MSGTKLERDGKPAGVNRRLLVALVGGAVVVGAVAMAASAATLAELGHEVGWVQKWGRVQMSWSLPVAVDALALVSGAVWLAASMSDAARRLARKITLAAVGGSVGLNALGHLVQSDDVKVDAWLRIGVSTVPPLVAAVVVHLVGVVLTTRHAVPAPAAPATGPAPAGDDQDETAAARPAAQPAPAPGPAPVPLTAVPARPFPAPDPAVSAPAAAQTTTPAPAAVAGPAAPYPAPAPVAPVASAPATEENALEPRTTADSTPVVAPGADTRATTPQPRTEAPVPVLAARTTPAPGQVHARITPETPAPAARPTGPVKDWDLPDLPADCVPGRTPELLSDDQAHARIRHGHANGWSQRRVAAFAGRSPSTVHKHMKALDTE